MGSSNTGVGGNKDESAADGGGSGDPPASDSPAFAEGEKVLAYHGPQLYEAKVRVRVRVSIPLLDFSSFLFVLTSFLLKFSSIFIVAIAAVSSSCEFRILN